MISPDPPGAGPLAERMRQLFSETGRLSRSPDFEYRPQQQQMAAHVGRALEQARPLVIEAGTGVGKSLAYLLPAVTHALESDRKALVSTHTINLQEQLLLKDIPIVAKLVDSPFEAVLMKGRRNYLCPLRLKRAIQSGADLFTSSEAAELQLLWRFMEQSDDGTLSSLDFHPSPHVWSHVSSEPHICTPRICGRDPRCAYQRMRRQANAAQIIVLNHTLFFTLLTAAEDLPGDQGFLYPDDFVILDEAHTVEQVAARQLGLDLNQRSLHFELQRLYNPRTRKGIFHQLRDARGATLTAELVELVDEFFLYVDAAIPQPDGISPAREFRLHQPIEVDDTLTGPLLELASQARYAADKLDEDTSRAELLDLASRLVRFRTAIADFLDLAHEDHVYWVERTTPRGRESFSPNSSLSLHSAPVDVAPILSNLFFQEGRRSIFTSATLGVGEPDLAYFRRRVGAYHADAVKIGSPFDYASQMRLYLLRDIPPPNAKGYQEALSSWIFHLLSLTDGHAFVLFTSYKLMAEMAVRLAPLCEARGWPLLIQGQSGPRHKILLEFRESEGAVLFGTESFWTGVDVPGKALSNVIITRLPFAVPDHPLTASRLEQIEAEGGNPFTQYSVPEAILKLRQGIGRLIRSSKDNGIAAILDNRILTRPYGRAFLKALPDCPVEILSGTPTSP